MLYILPVSPGLKLRTSSFVQAVHNRAVGNEGGGGTVRQAVGEVQSLELHQYKIAVVLNSILIKNEGVLHYKMFF